MHDNNASYTAKKKVNCYRVLKRNIRMKVNWNEWPLRWQMVMHIASLVIFFSLSNLVFIIAFTFFSYR
jgi:hypothetical protein